jgi:hypothetical protein
MSSSMNTASIQGQQRDSIARAVVRDVSPEGFAYKLARINAAHQARMDREADNRIMSATAYRIGQEEVCKELGLFSAWLDMADEGREASAYFTSISTAGLVREVLLNDRATDEQLAAAARELRTRYLADNEPEVMREAWRALA